MTSTRRERFGFHPVNVGHLVMGLVLLCGFAVWALVEGGDVSHDSLRWLLPVPWVVGGGVGLLVTAVTGPRRYAKQQTGWVGVNEPVAFAPDGPDLETETPEQQ